MSKTVQIARCLFGGFLTPVNRLQTVSETLARLNILNHRSITSSRGQTHAVVHCQFQSTSQVHTQHLSNSDMAMLQPATQAPDFTGKAIVNGDIKDISLSEYKGKYVVLLFYPADFTFVCPTEIIAFSDRADEFRKEGCEVIAISTDSEFTHLAWTNTPRESGGLGKMNIPLLADRTQKIATKYGVLKVDAGIAFRGLFIIDGKGVLRQITVNDLPVGRDVDETLRLVQAFKFTDEYGEVCPAGWRKGKETMKPTQEGVSKYLASQSKKWNGTVIVWHF